jgi:serine/threonine-protein kinase RsbW
MEIKLTLALPRDEVSVPVVRRLLKQSMEVLGVEPAVTSDIELALTEACTNVLDHAAEGDEYEVSAGIDGDQCVIEVVDRGGGFDGSLSGLADAEPSAEDGRGIQLMRALVDRVTFTSRPHKGTVVHLEKKLEWQDGSVIQRWTEDAPAVADGPWSREETMDDAPVSP